MRSSKKCLLFITLLVMINVFAVSFFPQHFVVSADENTVMGVFVVEKVWENDMNGNVPFEENGKRNRPSSVTICVEGSNGSANDFEISEADGWRKMIKLPLKVSGNQITYTAYEKNVPAKYVTNAPESGKIALRLISTGNDSTTYHVSPTGFDSIPNATVRIDPAMRLSEADRSLSSGFAYSTNEKVYANPEDSSKDVNSVAELLTYKGDLNKGENVIPGSVVLTWANKAEDISGKKYDVRITLSNMRIHVLKEMKGSNQKRIAILAYNKTLSMQSYVADFTSDRHENIVGVRADITIEVLGVASQNYVKVILDDIDIPDQVMHYRDKDTMADNDYYGLDHPYAESVIVRGTPASDVYVSDGTRYLVYDESTHKFASRANNNDATFDNKYTTLEYLANAGSYSFTWAGSDCGTTIVMDAALPKENDFLNTITNTTSVYVVRYFYQNNDGSYSSTPDEQTELRMVTPESEEKVTDDDLTPKKDGYFLDQREAYTKKYSGTTTTENNASNPLTLDVYFRKENYVIRYFYQNNDGTYSETPDATTEVTAVPASTEVSVSAKDKTPAEDKPGYFLDERTPYTTTWSGTTNEENYVNNPLTLNVYFRKENYVIRYFYQNDDGTYNEIPDDMTSVISVPASTKVEASDKDKTPAEDKPGYVLDKRDPYNKKWSGTTSEENYVDNPLILDVYFKKDYVVIYHDNVGDIVWDPKIQTNPELDYGVATPAYDTDPNTPGIQGGNPVRQGYDFVGWSEEPNSEIIKVPEIVTKNADYWAHWVPGINKYRVDYFYEVDGKYPTVADFSSSDRSAKTLDNVQIIENDKIPQKDYYVLNQEMKVEWKGVVAADGSLVLKVYFKQVPRPSTNNYIPPVTGIDFIR